MAFRVRSQLVNKIPYNFKNNYRKHKDSEGISDENDEGLKCHYCSDGGIMSQIHCIKCPAWGHLREGLNLTRIEDMVTFFTKLMEELDKK